MNLNIGKGRKEEIRVFEGDLPGKVALDFCQKHRLDPKIAKALEMQIKQQVDKYLVKRQSVAAGRSANTSIMGSHNNSRILDESNVGLNN